MVAAEKSPIVGDDGRREVIENSNGSKTMKLGLGASRGQRDGAAGALKKFDSTLLRKGSRIVAASVADDVSIAASTGDVSGLESVGKVGRRVIVGLPTATAFSPKNGGASTGSKGSNGNGNTGNGNIGNGNSESVGCGGGAGGGEARRSACRVDGVVAGNSVKFAGVFGAGSDVSYEVGGESVKEKIVLQSVPEAGRPVEYRFPLNVEG